MPPTHHLLQPFLAKQSSILFQPSPLQAWGTQTPQLDLCIRETFRRAQLHSAVRKNTGPELTTNNHTTPSGAFILYPFADTLLNPAVYPDPLKWNPTRDTPQQDKFIGWGQGKHFCKDQRLATLTMEIVVAYCLMRFDLAVVDGECMIRFSERRAGEGIYE